MSTPRTKRSASRVSKKASTPATPALRKRDRFAGVNPKLAALLRKHFTKKGRAERIARAEKAWKEAMEIASTFKKLDPETVKWIAEDPDLEYL
jgi:hypothetical protein